MKCTQPGCSYESTNSDPIIAKRNLGIHMSHTHGIKGQALQKAQERDQKRAGAKKAKRAGESPTDPLSTPYRDALERCAVAGQVLGSTASNNGELVAGFVLFLQGMSPGQAERALNVLGWKKEPRK